MPGWTHAGKHETDTRLQSACCFRLTGYGIEEVHEQLRLPFEARQLGIAAVDKQHSLGAWPPPPLPDPKWPAAIFSGLP